MIPTLRFGVDDLPVIVVLVLLVIMDRLKKELEAWLLPLEPYEFKLLLLLENIFEEYGSAVPIPMPNSFFFVATKRLVTSLLYSAYEFKPVWIIDLVVLLFE